MMEWSRLSVNYIGQKIAAFMGDNNDYGVSTEATVKSYRVLNDVEPMSSVLPYEAYDESRLVFVNESSIGFSLEFLPISGIDEETIEALVSLFNDELPTDGYVHVQMCATNKIGSLLNDFINGRKNCTDIEVVQAERRSEFFTRKTRETVMPSSGAVLRDLRVYLHYSQPIKDESLDCQIDEMIRMRSIWQNTLSKYMAVKCLSSTDLVAIAREFCAPSNENTWQNGDIRPEDSISQQIASCASSFAPESDSLKLSSEDEVYSVQTFNCERLPTRFALWQMLESVGRTFEFNQQVPCPFVINLHFVALRKESSRASIDTQFLANDKNAHSPMAKIFPSIRKKQEELNLLREIISENGCMARAYLSLTTFAKEGQEREVTTAVKQVMKSNGFHMLLDKDLQFAGFLLNMPYLMSEGLYQDVQFFKRFKKMTLFNAVNLMPILGDWKGNHHSTEPLYSSRRGQLMALSIFDSPIGNYNAVYSGDSGSGKSQAMQGQISDVLARGGLVYLIDMGGSAKRYVELMGGTSIVLNEELCINLFSEIKHYSESSSEVEAIITTMARPNGGASDEEKSLISRCASKAWEKHGNNATITKVVEELKNDEEKRREAHNLVLLLEKYCEDGKYGRYFNGKTSIDLNNRFVEIDFEQVRKKKDLKSVLVMIMMLLINEKFYDENERPDEKIVPKLCIIDEAWDLLHNSLEAAEFIGASYRRVRKHNGAFMTIVQQLDAFFENQMGKAAYDNSDYRFIFAQTVESIDYSIASGHLKLSPYEERLVKSLTTTNYYAECFIQTKNVGSGLVRVIYEPFSRILHSSKKQHVQRIRYHQSQDHTLTEAIALVAREEYPNEW